jgi:hypothetical protein
MQLHTMNRMQMQLINIEINKKYTLNFNSN